MYHFPITRETLRDVLSTALGRGGEYADIFLEHTLATNVVLQDGLVSQAHQAVIFGAGIRVISGSHTGYAYTMDLSPNAMLNAARFAATIGSGGIVAYPSHSVSQVFCTDSVQVLESCVSRQYLLFIDQLARSMDPRVIRVKATISQRIQDVELINSFGECFADQRPRASIMISIVMQQNGQTQMGYATQMLQMGIDFFSEQRIREVVEEAVSRTAFLFTAKQIRGGEMPVVMAAGASGILMHEAIGHSFEADFIRTGESIFADKIGEMICAPCINIVDDGTMSYDAGFLHFDDEGVLGERTVLVDHGRLNSYMHDRITAKFYGVKPTGNGRRESFRYPPQPRMRSTYMLEGDASEEDIIHSVKRGIYAQTFTNGQVQIGAGDFTFFMKQGYLIENGHLTQPIRDMNIIGNGPRVLKDISIVGNNLKIDHSAYMCGKGGQSIPVSQGLPTVLVKRLVVG